MVSDEAGERATTARPVRRPHRPIAPFRNESSSGILARRGGNHLTRHGSAMKIGISGKGIHRREIAGIEKLRGLPSHWYAFTNLELIQAGAMPRQIDVVIVVDPSHTIPNAAADRARRLARILRQAATA